MLSAARKLYDSWCVPDTKEQTQPQSSRETIAVSAPLEVEERAPMRLISTPDVAVTGFAIWIADTRAASSFNFDQIVELYEQFRAVHDAPSLTERRLSHALSHAFKKSQPRGAQRRRTYTLRPAYIQRQKRRLKSL